MKKKHFFLISIFLISLLNYSQEIINFKGKNYNATPIWNFYCEDYAYSSDLKVQIAKTENGGILKLLIETSSENLFIGDKILIILKDGSLIYCGDKKIYQNFGQEKATYYFLTNLEINKLKIFEIENIRFQIIGKETKFSSKTGYFLASKKVNYKEESEKKDSVNTALDIKLLFKNKELILKNKK